MCMPKAETRPSSTWSFQNSHLLAYLPIRTTIFNFEVAILVISHLCVQEVTYRLCKLLKQNWSVLQLRVRTCAVQMSFPIFHMAANLKSNVAPKRNIF